MEHEAPTQAPATGSLLRSEDSPSHSRGNDATVSYE
jgi:hypothetical protein